MCFLIGAAKSGTTTLHEYLSRHPDLRCPVTKEPDFFANRTHRELGTSWYLALFQIHKDARILLDASTTYSRHPHTGLDPARQIRDTVVDPKFVYIMRDPVERAYSHYRHHMRTGVTMTFEQALQQSDEYIDTGRYADQIERYLRLFPKERFCFLLTEDLQADTHAAVAKVLAFLGLDADAIDTRDHVRKNVAGHEYFIKARTSDLLWRTPVLSSIVAATPPRPRRGLYRAFERSPIGRALARRHRVPAMHPRTRRRLAELYQEPNRRLARLIDRDLSHWTTPDQG